MERPQQTALLPLVFGALVCLGQGPAHAQNAAQTAQAEATASEITRGATVMNRSRPELDPLGVHVGGFLLYPQLMLGEDYRDNIFDTQSNAQSDEVTQIRPSLRLQSNFGRHSIALYTDADIGRYAGHSREDYEDYTVGGAGRLDVVGHSHLDLGSSYKHLHEDRASPDDVRGRTPTVYSDTNVSLGGTAALNRLMFSLDTNFDRYDFSNVRDVTTGTVIDNQDRNRNVYAVTARAGYELAPLREVFVRGGYNRRHYDRSFDNAGFNRRSDGYEVAVGANYDLTGVTFVEAYVGYREQRYADARLPNVSGIGAGAKLIWNVTRLTTITGGVTRDIEETTQAGASAYFSTRVTVGVDHELLRNLILRANALYGNDDFSGITRNDDYYGTGFSAIYQMNRFFSITGSYGFRDRESNVAGQNFAENVIGLRLTGRY